MRGCPSAPVSEASTKLQRWTSCLPPGEARYRPTRSTNAPTKKATRRTAVATATAGKKAPAKKGRYDGHAELAAKWLARLRERVAWIEQRGQGPLYFVTTEETAYRLTLDRTAYFERGLD